MLTLFTGCTTPMLHKTRASVFLKPGHGGKYFIAEGQGNQDLKLIGATVRPINQYAAYKSLVPTTIQLKGYGSYNKETKESLVQLNLPEGRYLIQSFTSHVGSGMGKKVAFIPSNLVFEIIDGQLQYGGHITIEFDYSRGLFNALQLSIKDEYQRDKSEFGTYFDLMNKQEFDSNFLYN